MNEYSQATIAETGEEARKVRFDQGTADVVTFDPSEVAKLLDRGDIVFLLGIAADGSLTLFESPENPIKIFDEPHTRYEEPIARVALSLYRCGCKDNRRCVASGNSCVKGPISCPYKMPPCD